MSTPAQLCEELNQNATISGQRELERRLADLAIWHYSQKNFISEGNIPKRMEFLEKSFWVQLEVIALLLERVHGLEGSKSLWVPNGMDIRGDLRG
jgi:hypothetical protein